MTARARRLFAAELPVAGGMVLLPPESVEHAQVLRLTVGTQISLFDAIGGEASARIIRSARSLLECEAEPRRTLPRRAGGLQLLVGLPKAGKLETIVRMTTELGVQALHVISSERAVPKASGDSLKLERLRRVAREACAQSGQAFAPAIAGPLSLAAACREAPPAALKLAFWEEASVPLAAAVSGMELGCEVWAVVGPEGGLSGTEAELLAQHGFALVGLGSHILRVETACVVVSALLLDRLAAFGGG